MQWNMHIFVPKQWNMEQIERIRQMEGLFDWASETMKKSHWTFNEYATLKKSMAILSNYYTSEEWKQDYADEEAGKFPKDLKRGILSEDGIWNLLCDWRNLKRG